MSRTLIQQFFELAKLETKAPAFSLSHDRNTYTVPWGLMKSKVKHCALGFLSHSVEKAQYVYLFDSKHPEQMYLELGALSISLQTLSIPSDISLNQLRELFELYPPSFIYLGDKNLFEIEEILKDQKNLQLMITHSDPATPPTSKIPILSFRRLLNLGIRREGHHYQIYRQKRDWVKASDIISPIWVNQEGKISYTGLSYDNVNQMIAVLSCYCSKKKVRKLLSDLPLSFTLGRIFAFYWPIFIAGHTTFSSLSELLGDFKHAQPNIALLSSTSLEFLKDLPLQKIKSTHTVHSSIWTLQGIRSFLERKTIKRNIQKILGKNLKYLCGTQDIPSELGLLFAHAEISFNTIEKILPRS